MDVLDDLESTPLFYASAHGHDNVALMLLSKGAQTNIKDKVFSTIVAYVYSLIILHF